VDGNLLNLLVVADERSGATASRLYTVQEPVHLTHTLEFYVNLQLDADGLAPIKVRESPTPSHASIPR
jgi:hypothetical protein